MLDDTIIDNTIINEKISSLAELNVGQRARIIVYNNNNKTTRRLIELGFIPGKEIYYVRKAPLKDPIEIQIGCSYISIRNSEASLILVEPI